MKKFKFNLSTLLQVRGEAENEAHRELLKAHIHLKKMLKSIEDLETEYILLNEEVERKQKKAFSAEKLSDQHDYLMKLEQRIKLQVEEVVKAQINLEEKRLLVVQAIQKKKTIENLQDKQYAVWENEYLIKEAAFFDEVSTIYFIREKREKSEQTTE